ncbi:hypothetical protein GCM10023334_089240 [Nonomuraea thailandensis]
MRVRLDSGVQVVDTCQNRDPGEQRVLVQRGRHVGIVRLRARIGLAHDGPAQPGLPYLNGDDLGGQ